jgi:3-hydroxyisobutyrate dehydrogenase-like beta-hydroxyacid dehydrogenase
MDGTESTERKANNLAFKLLGSYLISIALLIASILVALVAAKDFGVDQDLVRKANMGTPVIAIALSLVIHYVVKQRVKSAFKVSIGIFVLSFLLAIFADV